MSINAQQFGGSVASVETDQETGEVIITGDIVQSIMNAPVLAADSDGKIVAGEAPSYNLLITTLSTPAGILASKSAFETATGKQTYRYGIIGNNIYIGIKKRGGLTNYQGIFLKTTHKLVP